MQRILSNMPNFLVRFGLILVVIALLAIQVRCAESPCRPGDNSRFKCDPTAAEVPQWLPSAE